MCADPDAAIARVAGLCGIALTPELAALTRARSDIGFMLEHKSKFDDRLMREASERRCGLPPGSDSAKVRQGGSGGYRQALSPETAAELDAQWRKLVTPSTGFADYAAFEAALRARNLEAVG
jgi:hypothetical protein